MIILEATVFSPPVRNNVMKVNIYIYILGTKKTSSFPTIPIRTCISLTWMLCVRVLEGNVWHYHEEPAWSCKYTSDILGKRRPITEFLDQVLLEELSVNISVLRIVYILSIIKLMGIFNNAWKSYSAESGYSLWK